MEDSWWKLTFKSETPDDNSDLLFDLGVQAVEKNACGTFNCYFEGKNHALNELENKLSELNVLLVKKEIIPPANWLKNCEELWQKIDFENFSVVPVLDEDNLPLLSENCPDIFILPGEGFGTGHHSSTKLAIRLIKELDKFCPPPQNALDVGCGSGILSLTINKLYDSKVMAIDTDERALGNAEINLKLNRTANKVVLSNLPISELKDKYDLIAANIYAEVLIEMKPDFERLLINNGCLLISGIMSSLADDVKEAYYEPMWTLLKESQESGWHALLYKYK